MIRRIINSLTDTVSQQASDEIMRVLWLSGEGLSGGYHYYIARLRAEWFLFLEAVLLGLSK